MAEKMHGQWYITHSYNWAALRELHAGSLWTYILIHSILSMHTTGICFRLDDAHLSSEACTQSRLEGLSCLPPCLNISTSKLSILGPGIIFNPWRIHKGYGIIILYVCVRMQGRSLVVSWLPGNPPWHPDSVSSQHDLAAWKPLLTARFNAQIQKSLRHSLNFLLLHSSFILAAKIAEKRVTVAFFDRNGDR